MKLTEAEMRMVFQIESTNQNAALNEIYMTWRYAPNPATKETAESLLDKLRPLSDQECMDLIRKVQAEYRLPESYLRQDQTRPFRTLWLPLPPHEDAPLIRLEILDVERRS